MVDKYADQIALFEQKVHALIKNNAALKIECEKLTEELAKEKHNLMQAHKTILELQEQCSHLHTANALAVTEEEKVKAKDRLGKMVREIDKCIALLTE